MATGAKCYNKNAFLHTKKDIQTVRHGDRQHTEIQIKSNQIIYLVKQIQRHWQNE